MEKRKRNEQKDKGTQIEAKDNKENYMILTLSTPIATQQLELHLFVG